METVIAKTSKGARVWIQGLERHGWTGGDRFTTTFQGSTIVHQRDPNGKRKVTAAKGGIIDTVGKKVTQWAQGASTATVHMDCNRIVITREAS